MEELNVFKILNREQVLFKVAHNGLMLKQFERFLADKEVVLTAVKENAYAFIWADETLTNDIHFTIECCLVNPLVVKELSQVDIKQLFNQHNNDPVAVKNFLAQQQADKQLLDKLSQIKIPHSNLFKRRLNV